LQLILHSELRRRAASRRALPCPSSCYPVPDRSASRICPRLTSLCFIRYVKWPLTSERLVLGTVVHRVVLRVNDDLTNSTVCVWYWLKVRRTCPNISVCQWKSFQAHSITTASCSQSVPSPTSSTTSGKRRQWIRSFWSSNLSSPRSVMYCDNYCVNKC